jgi:5-methylcytosine-specific restriction enzyme A
MPRELPEWIGRTPDAAIPPRIRLRIYDRFGGRCQCGCGRKIAVGESWDCEDEIAIINGGQRRESNLRPFLTEHHKEKTRRDVAVKSKTYKTRSRHVGIKRRKGRPMPGGRNSPFKKKLNGEVVLR